MTENTNAPWQWWRPHHTRCRLVSMENHPPRHRSSVGQSNAWPGHPIWPAQPWNWLPSSTNYQMASSCSGMGCWKMRALLMRHTGFLRGRGYNLLACGSRRCLSWHINPIGTLPFCHPCLLLILNKACPHGSENVHLPTLLQRLNRHVIFMGSLYLFVWPLQPHSVLHRADNDHKSH